MCLINHGPGEKATMYALDKKTGKTIWQHAEPILPESKEGKAGFYGSWSDPVPRVIHGQPQLLMSWPYRVCAMDPLTSGDLWTCDGLNPLVYTSPLMEGDIVVGMGGYSGKALAVKAGGKGDVTETHRLWHHPKSATHWFGRDP